LRDVDVLAEIKRHASSHAATTKVNDLLLVFFFFCFVDQILLSNFPSFRMTLEGVEVPLKSSQPT